VKGFSQTTNITSAFHATTWPARFESKVNFTSQTSLSTKMGKVLPYIASADKKKI